MARADIYYKQGKLNYKEQKLIDRLDATARELQLKDPTFKYKKAESFEELKALHDKYCIQDVDYHEIKSDKAPADGTEKPAEEVHAETVEGTGQTEPKKVQIDPLNSESPVVNDYVMDNQHNNGQNNGQSETTQTNNFSEPTTFDEAFAIPEDQAAGGNKGGGPQQTQQFGQSQQKGPSSGGGLSDGNSAGRKRRSTKKLAAYLVKIACLLIEKGYVYIVTKDITEAKLLEYELRGEIDLSLMVTMTNGQIEPVSAFFRDMRLDAAQDGKVDPEAAADLVDALTDLLLEKDIHPTPAQEVMLIAASIIVPMGLNAFAKKMEATHILNQLREMKGGHYTNGHAQPHEEVRTPASEGQPIVKEEPPESFETATAEPTRPVAPVVDTPEPLIVDENAAIKETPE